MISLNREKGVDSMNVIEKKTMDQERALYGEEHIIVKNCVFDGPADGESALKECRDVTVDHCYCNLRYPFWHDSGLVIRDSCLTENCRAAVWYSDQIEITGTELHGIKALRECSQVHLEACSIRSAEFGWSVRNLRMKDSSAQSEYFLMRGEMLTLSHVDFQGKYSFQYVKHAVLDHCHLDTKDAFWHGEDITVKNSVIKGEYLGWYSRGLTLINCRIIGTQPLCYCRDLKLIDCEMEDTDLCFEKSQVDAALTTPVISIKNPLSGVIRVPEVGTVIRDDRNSHGEIIIG